MPWKISRKMMSNKMTLTTADQLSPGDYIHSIQGSTKGGVVTAVDQQPDLIWVTLDDDPKPYKMGYHRSVRVTHQAFYWQDEKKGDTNAEKGKD